PAIRPAAMLLANYTSCADLLSGLRAHTAASVTAYGLPGQSTYFQVNGPVPLSAAPVAGPVAGPAGGGVGSDTSITNDQEQGVDEPDIVKTEAGRVVTITDGVLRVVDDATRTVTGSLDLTMYQGAQNAELLVEGDNALVLLGSPSTSYGYGYGMRPALPPAASSSLSTYLFVDLSGQPKVTGSMRASGGYLDARLVGSTVRLVVNSGPSLTFPYGTGSAATRTAANQAIVKRAPLSAWLPQYSVTTASGVTKSTVPCGQVSHPASYTGASMLTVYTLDLTHLGSAANPVSVAADGNTVYATASSLYVATSATQQTEIHRFDIAGSAPPRYLGSGSVAGLLLSQYSLSDYDGSLRIATTTGASGGGSEAGNVYVLNADTLKTTGHVGQLRAGEQIYAVRFLGPVAYVVTFKQTDPLYVIDLSKPTAPKIVGQLSLTGYSDYLHDAGDGRLLGVGQEASAQGRVAGLQVSLFDVSNPKTPTRTGHVVVPGAVGEATLDPHQFLYWPPTGLIAVPTQAWTPGESGKVLILRLSGASLTSLGQVANPLAEGTTDDGLGIQRSLIVDGALWTLSGSGIQVTNPTTLARQAWLPFS
ncbi:MAG: hypothetical protein JWO63_1240, partial [Frankiales bacterium]|nr:hypothetical protein [Frankiales bacterium]